MRRNGWNGLVGGFCLLFLLHAGCSSDDKSSNPGEDDPEANAGRYLVEAYFGNALVPGGSFHVYLGRLDPSDPSAADGTVDVNGTSIPILGNASSPDDAVFFKTNFGYQADSSYTVTVRLHGKQAVCSFVAPAYPWVEITSPADGSDFDPGDPISLRWIYYGGTPENVYVEVWSDTGEEDVPLYEAQLGGVTMSHTIPGSSTTGWGQYEEMLITVDLGEKIWPFSGDLPVLGSFLATVLPGDAIMIASQGDQEEDVWSVTVTLGDYSLEADGASTTQVWATVENQWGSPCPENTTVTFSVQPPGYATLQPGTATTAGGEAASVLTAGTTPGTVEVHASALGASGYSSLSLSAATAIDVGTGSHPTISWTPAGAMYGLIVRQGGYATGNLRWTITTSGLNGFIPPVTYGTVPANGMQIYPLLGAAPDPLVPGTQYTVGLIAASGDTTFQAFTP